MSKGTICWRNSRIAPAYLSGIEERFFQVPFYKYIGVIWSKKFRRGSLLCIIFCLNLSEQFAKCFMNWIERIEKNTSEIFFWFFAEDFRFSSKKFRAGSSKILSTCLTKRCSEIVFWTLFSSLCWKTTGELSKLLSTCPIYHFGNFSFGIWTQYFRTLIGECSDGYQNSIIFVRWIILG